MRYLLPIVLLLSACGAQEEGEALSTLSEPLTSDGGLVCERCVEMRSSNGRRVSYHVVDRPERPPY